MVSIKASMAHCAPKADRPSTLSDLPTELRTNIYDHLVSPGYRSLFEEDAGLYYDPLPFPAALAQTSKFFHVYVAEYYDYLTRKRPRSVAILCREGTYSWVLHLLLRLLADGRQYDSRTIMRAGRTRPAHSLDKWTSAIPFHFFHKNIDVVRTLSQTAPAPRFCMAAVRDFYATSLFMLRHNTSCQNVEIRYFLETALTPVLEKDRSAHGSVHWQLLTH